MALTVGELNAYLKLDDSAFTRGLDVAAAKFTAFKGRIDTQLAELDRSLKGMAAEVKITADTKQADRDVRAFVRRMNALKISINVNVNITQALQRLQQVQDRLREINRLKASVTVNVDAGAALTELREIRDLVRRIDGTRASVTVTANTARAEAALRRLELAQRNAGNTSGLSRLGSALASIGSAAGSLAQTVSTAGLIGAALGAAIPAAAGLVAALADIAPAAAIGATAVFSLASAFGAIKLGTSGIGGALKAAFAPASGGGGGGGAANSARQVASAMRAVKDATREAAYANQQAARQVSDAERDVADAQKAARQAQLDLNDARVQATRDLEDLNDQLADARLDERSATADVTDALDALNTARAQGMGPGTDMDALQLAYDKAVQKLKEAQEQTSRLSDDTAKANKAGVDGSKTMVDARQNVADANRALSDQERALSDARVQQARTAAQGLENIQKAQEALAAAGASAGGSGGGVDKFAQALAKLSPNARAFVREVIALRTQWTALQQAVQNRLFEGLAAQLRDTAQVVLPILRQGLVDTAGALNGMAVGAFTAAREVGKDGTLGQALASASAGLQNLAGLPAFVLRALTQLAVAAGPAFERLTASAGAGIESLGKKLDEAFSSGRLRKSIDTAVGLIRQMGTIAGNVGRIIGAIFAPANASGAGFLNTLQNITGALATALSSPAVQAGMGAVFGLFSQLSHMLANGLGPIITQIAGAFAQLAPVITSTLQGLGDATPVVALLLLRLNPVLSVLALLAPVLGQLAAPIGLLVQGLAPLLEALGKFAGQLGQALVPVVTALAPVLATVAGVLGTLLTAVSPLLGVLGDLIALALKPLTPIFKLVGDMIAGLAPVVEMLADGLGKSLTPILTSLGEVLGRIAKQYGLQFTLLLEQLLPLIPVLVPVMVQLGESIGQILLSIEPLIPQLMMLSTQLILELLPAILPLIPVIAELATAFLVLATGTITKVVVPILSGLIKFVGGFMKFLKPGVDAVNWFSKAIAGAFQWLYDILLGHSIIPDIINGAVGWFKGLPGKAWNALSSLGSNLAGRARDAGTSMVNAIKTGLTNAVSWIGGLPGRAKNVLGNIGSTLYKSGQSLIGGFIDGIKSMLGNVGNAVSGVVGHARDFFPFSPAKTGPFSGKGWTKYSGIAVASDFAAGLSTQHGVVSDAANALMGAAHDGLAVPGTPMGALVAPPGRYAGQGGPGAGGTVTAKVTAVLDVRGGTDPFTTALRKAISVSGGDVQLVLGTG